MAICLVIVICDIIIRIQSAIIIGASGYVRPRSFMRILPQFFHVLAGRYMSSSTIFSYPGDLFSY